MIDIQKTLQPLVDRVTRSVHASFPSHHSQADTEQALWLWVYENMNTVTAVVRDDKRREGTLYPLMVRAANTHLKREDQAVYGYSSEDVFVYTRDVIEELLEVVFDHEDWQSFAMKLDSQPRAKMQANQTGDHLAMYADVKSAVDKLSDAQREAILWRYANHYTYENIGAELGISKQAAQDRVSRAVSAVQKALGQRELSDLRSGYSSRTDPSSIAEAIAVTDRTYNGS